MTGTDTTYRGGDSTMDFLNNLGSSAMASVAGVVLAGGGALLFKLLNVLYDSFHVTKLINENATKLGNEAGLKIYHAAIKKIKDEKLKQKAIKDLDKAGDLIDEGWDKGLRGNKI